MEGLLSTGLPRLVWKIIQFLPSPTNWELGVDITIPVCFHIFRSLLVRDMIWMKYAGKDYNWLE